MFLWSCEQPLNSLLYRVSPDWSGAAGRAEFQVMWPILELAFRLEVSVTCYSCTPVAPGDVMQISSVWAVVFFRVCPVRC